MKSLTLTILMLTLLVSIAFTLFAQALTPQQSNFPFAVLLASADKPSSALPETTMTAPISQPVSETIPKPPSPLVAMIIQYVVGALMSLLVGGIVYVVNKYLKLNLTKDQIKEYIKAWCIQAEKSIKTPEQVAVIKGLVPETKQHTEFINNYAAQYSQQKLAFVENKLQTMQAEKPFTGKVIDFFWKTGTNAIETVLTESLQSAFKSKKK